MKQITTRQQRRRGRQTALHGASWRTAFSSKNTPRNAARRACARCRCGITGARTHLQNIRGWRQQRCAPRYALAARVFTHYCLACGGATCHHAAWRMQTCGSTVTLHACAAGGAVPFDGTAWFSRLCLDVCRRGRDIACVPSIDAVEQRYVMIVSSAGRTYFRRCWRYRIP